MASSRREDYLYPTGVIKVLETRLLTKDGIERLIDARSFDDALHVLREIGYAEEELRKDIDGSLDTEAKGTYALMLGISPTREFIDLFLINHDFYNLKLLAKYKLGLIPKSDVDRLWLDLGTMPARIDVDASLDELGKTMPDYAHAVETVIKHYERLDDPQVIGAGLDAEFLAALTKIQDEFLSGVVRAYIDFCNLKTIIRAKEMGKRKEFMEAALAVGGDLDKDELLDLYAKNLDVIFDWIGKSRYGDDLSDALSRYRGEGLMPFEGAVSEAITRRVKSAKYIPYGLEPLFIYLFKKVREIRSIRAVLRGKKNELPPEDIRVILSAV